MHADGVGINPQQSAGMPLLLSFSFSRQFLFLYYFIFVFEVFSNII